MPDVGLTMHVFDPHNCNCQVLADERFWDALRDVAAGSGLPYPYMYAIYTEWVGIPLHSMMAEVCGERISLTRNVHSSKPHSKLCR